MMGAGGREIPAFAVAPDQSGVIYLAAGHSYEVTLHRSTDWGRTWQPIGADLRCSTGLYSFAVDPRDNSVVYAFAAACGFIKSTDAGETWSEPRLGFYGPIIIDPAEPDRLFLLDSGGVWESHDAGDSWAPDPFLGHGMYDLEFDPRDPDTRYAVFGGAVFRSTDRGASWRLFTEALLDEDEFPIAVSGVLLDPHDPDTISTWNQSGVYRTTDGGSSWEIRGIFADDFDFSRMLSSRETGSRFYAISQMHGVFSSDDAGRTWAPINANLAPIQPRQLSLIGRDPERLWIGTTRGLFSRKDGGDQWEAHNRGFGTGGEVLAVVPDRPEWIYLRGSESLYRTRDGGSTWYPVAVAGYPTSVVPHPTDPTRAWLATAVDSGTEIHRTNDGGLTWLKVGQGLGASTPVIRMIGDRLNWRILYAASAGALFRSPDEGFSWVKVLDGQDYFTILVQDESPVGTVYAGGVFTGLFASHDRGMTWRSLLDEYASVSHLAVDPKDPSILYTVSLRTQINRSTNGGESWEVMRPWPNHAPVHDLLVDPTEDGVLYVTDEDRNVCVSRDGGRHWAPFEPSWPGTDRVGPFLLTPEARLYVGTFDADIRHIDLGSQFEVLFPQIGDGESWSGGRFQTTIQLLNQASETEALLRFFDSRGDPLPLALDAQPPAHEHRIRLDRGQSFSATTPGTGDLSVGYARVSGGPGLAGAAVFSYSEDGTTLFQAGVPSAGRMSGFGLLVDISESEDNGFALVNTGAVPTDGNLRVVDSDGATLADRKLSDMLGGVPLGPGQHIARYVSEAFPELSPGPFSGQVFVRAAEPLAPISLRQNDQPDVEFPQDIRTLSIFPVLRNLLDDQYMRVFCCPRLGWIVFPHVADGVDRGVRAQTFLRLSRHGWAREQFRIRFIESDGTLMDVELEGADAVYEPQTGNWVFRLERGGSTTLRTKGTGELKVGYAIVLASAQELDGTAFFSWTEGGVRLFETGVPAANPLTDFTIFVDSDPGLLETAVAMVNVGYSSATATFRLYDRAGALVASRTWKEFLSGPGDFSDRKYEKKALFVHEIFEGAKVGEGIMTVQSDQPLAAVTLRQRDDPTVSFPEDIYLITVFPVVPGRHDF